MEGAKAEGEKKVSKILKFIQNKDKIPKDAKKELRILVHDLQKHCQSLYPVVISDKKSRGRNGKLKSTSSISGSESDYFSSEEIGSSHSQNEDAYSEHLVGDWSQELEAANLEVLNLQLQLSTSNEEKEVLNKKYTEALTNLQKLERESSARKEEIESQIKTKATEVKRLGEKNKGLLSRISELEMISKERGDEIAKLLMRLEDNEKISMSRIEVLKLELDSLRSHKDELEAGIAEKTSEQLSSMQNELASLHSEKTDIESLLNMKTKEVSENQTLIQNLEDELARKTKVEQIMLEEKEGFLVKMKYLEQEVMSVNEQKYYMEEQKTKFTATCQLREEEFARNSENEKIVIKERDNLVVRVKELEQQVVSLNKERIDMEECTKMRDEELAKSIKNEEMMVVKLNNLEEEIRFLDKQKKDLEEQIRTKFHETSQCTEEKRVMQDRIKELNAIEQEKQKTFMSRIEDLKLELDSLRSHKDELEAGIALKTREQLDSMQNELSSLHSERTEIESLLEMKTKEVSQKQILIKTLEEELARKTKVEQTMQDEKEGLLAKMKYLEQEVMSLNEQKSYTEEQKSKFIAICQLREEEFARNSENELIMVKERDSLLVRVKELEQQVVSLNKERIDMEEQIKLQSTKMRDEELAKLIKNEEMMVLKVNNLEEEIRSLDEQKKDLEEQIRTKFHEISQCTEEKRVMQDRIKELNAIEQEKQDYVKRMTEIEDQNSKLSSEIAKQQRILKVQDEMISKLNEDQKPNKRWSSGSNNLKINQQILERKVEELAEDFRMKMEDHIRLLKRRIQIAEQIHMETKTLYNNMKDNPKQNYEVKIKALLKPGMTMVGGLDLAMSKLEENGTFLNRVSKMTGDVRSAKSWVAAKNNEVEQLKHEADSLLARLECKEAQESLLREKLSKLEDKLSEEGGEKMKLTKRLKKFEKKVEQLENELKENQQVLLSLGNEKREAIRQLENELKEKQEVLLSLGNEKREAIRQLCILLDYHLTRYHHLKISISKMVVTRR